MEQTPDPALRQNDEILVNLAGRILGKWNKPQTPHSDKMMKFWWTLLDGQGLLSKQINPILVVLSCNRFSSGQQIFDKIANKLLIYLYFFGYSYVSQLFFSWCAPILWSDILNGKKMALESNLIL